MDLRMNAQERFVRETLQQFIVHGKATASKYPEGPEWERIARLVHINNLGPLFHYTCHSLASPPREMQVWKGESLHLLMSNLHKLKVAVGIFELFERSGIRAVGLRGLSLAHDLYPDAGIRPMKDLDILVDAGGHQDVVQAMSRGGHAPLKQLRRQVVYDIQGVEVEVHLALLTTKRYQLQFSREKLLDSRIRMDTPEGSLYRLADEHELIELVAHALIHHELQGLFRVVDIGLLMTRRDLDWEMIVRWCRESRLSNMFQFTLALVDHLFRLGHKAPSYFPRSLPAHVRRSFDSYGQFYFGGENIRHYLRRKRNLFFVAETAPLWSKQFLRLFSGSTLREVRQVLGPHKYPFSRLPQDPSGRQHA